MAASQVECRVFLKTNFKSVLLGYQMSGTQGLRHSLFLLSFVTRLFSKKFYWNPLCKQDAFANKCPLVKLFSLIFLKRKKKSEGLGLDSSWGLRTFSLSHARDKTKKILHHFFTELKTSHLYFQVRNMTLSTLLILAVCRARVI